MFGEESGLCHVEDAEKFIGSATGEATGDAGSLGTGDWGFGECKFNGVVAGDSGLCVTTIIGETARFSVSSDLICLATGIFDGYLPVRDKSSGFVLKFSGSISGSASASGIKQIGKFLISFLFQY